MTRGHQSLRAAVARLLFACALMACGLPVPAPADTTGYLTPSLAIGAVYDDNIFSAPVAREADEILRVSPALEAGYDSADFNVDGFYSFDAERYNKHPGLNGNTVRRNAALDMGWRATPRLGLALDSDYTATETPSEISPQTSLVGRAHATFFNVNPSLSYLFGETYTGRAGYSYSHETVAQGTDTNVDTAMLGLDHTLDPRNILGADFAASRYDFGDDREPVDSRVLTFDWTHALTPQTSFSFAAGPRDTEGSVNAEVRAGLRHVLDDGYFTLDAARSQTVVVGQVGVVETRSLNANYDSGLGQDVEIQVAPSYASDTIGSTKAEVLRLNLSMAYRLGRITSLVGSYQYSLQRGLLSGGDQEIRDNILYIGLVFSAPSAGGRVFDERRRTPFETLWPSPRRNENLPPSSDLVPTPYPDEASPTP